MEVGNILVSRETTKVVRDELSTLRKVLVGDKEEGEIR